MVAKQEGGHPRGELPVQLPVCATREQSGRSTGLTTRQHEPERYYALVAWQAVQAPQTATHISGVRATISGPHSVCAVTAEPIYSPAANTLAAVRPSLCCEIFIAGSQRNALPIDNQGIASLHDDHVFRSRPPFIGTPAAQHPILPGPTTTMSPRWPVLAPTGITHGISDGYFQTAASGFDRRAIARSANSRFSISRTMKSRATPHPPAVYV